MIKGSKHLCLRRAANNETQYLEIMLVFFWKTATEIMYIRSVSNVFKTRQTHLMFCIADISSIHEFLKTSAMDDTSPKNKKTKQCAYFLSVFIVRIGEIPM